MKVCFALLVLGLCLQMGSSLEARIVHGKRITRAGNVSKDAPCPCGKCPGGGRAADLAEGEPKIALPAGWTPFGDNWSKGLLGPLDLVGMRITGECPFPSLAACVAVLSPV